MSNKALDGSTHPHRRKLRVLLLHQNDKSCVHLELSLQDTNSAPAVVGGMHAAPRQALTGRLNKFPGPIND